MPHIPRAFIDQLIADTDIVSLIDHYVSLKKQGSSFIACCPFHQEKTPSFHVVPKKQFYHCFGCGTSGNVISFIMAYLHQSFLEAIETLALRAGLSLPQISASAPEKPIHHLHHVLLTAATFYHKILFKKVNPAQQYLIERGLTPRIIEQYRLGYAPEGWQTLSNIDAFKAYRSALAQSGMVIPKKNGPETYDRFRHRLMFPIEDAQGRVIGFGGRALDAAQKPKYLNSPETPIFHKSKALYGLFQTLHTQAPLQHIIVVEGYMDVLTLVQAGFKHVVATLGTSTSSSHLQTLFRHTRHLIFCFDGDKAGFQAAQKALQQLLSFLDQPITATFVFLPDQHDPDSYLRKHGAAAFQTQLEQGFSLTDYLMQTIMQNTDLNTLEGKSHLIHQAQPYLQSIPEGPFKTLITEALSKKVKTHAEQLQPLFTTTNLSSPPPSPRQTIKRTPERLAIALLVQYPTHYPPLATTYPPHLFNTLFPLLSEIMQHIIRSSILNTAQLIEYFRETPHFEVLQRLAAWDIPLIPTHISDEMADTFRFLQQKADEQNIRALIERSKSQGLSRDEQTQLATLLQKKNNIL